jgi:hypothetical protein
MSGRIEKSKSKSEEESKKTLERKSLTARVRQHGLFADMPCSYCSKHKKSCLMKEDSTRCGECSRRGRSCDGILVGSSLARAMKEEERLAKEEELMEEKILANQREAERIAKETSEAVAKLLRLRKQRKFIKSKGDDLFRRGMQQLDEDDARERAASGKEQLVPEEEIEAMAATTGPFDVVDWSAVDWDSLGLENGSGELGLPVESEDTGQERRSPQHVS